ncbi:MAG: hypothetical protein DWQ05_05265 [Calditrichaeota bacterium]|nr:MAG: hypothetical protein DWQ05_05265 [Calditrichota bacterium]
MADKENILTLTYDLLLYLIPQLGTPTGCLFLSECRRAPAARIIFLQVGAWEPALKISAYVVTQNPPRVTNSGRICNRPLRWMGIKIGVICVKEQHT